ncbi:hypothetical protein EUX98_g6602 [Antrodiella citrinella]|uniref:AAA+ ATPase domain-containing protein n=1 Tax=Antrodiella citrinella TaxID=2447956 RepID=A0A4S4MR42_9APHY|nr:hypothetical protein EUX98_g6602 [Antrodiella citrinella]
MSACNFSSVLSSQFSSSLSNPELNIIKHLKSIHGPRYQVISTTVPDKLAFPLTAYLESIGSCPHMVPEESYSTFIFDSAKDKQSLSPHLIAGIAQFTYTGTFFRVYLASWTVDFNPFHFYGLVYESSSDELGCKLALEVYRYSDVLREGIWVYDDGSWTRDKSLQDAVQATRWDNIVLTDQFKENLQRDTKTFFESEDVYNSLGMTWKRGILLLGPPGNGKTESIKALLNGFRHEALYVKSFSSPCGPEFGIKTIFDHARRYAPCLLILEDLDSMVTPLVRSYLLNELDGLAQNSGILTVATTNHPERIEDAILNRPSRFDVKYEFGLPSLELRKRFAQKWIDKVQNLGAAAADAHGSVLGHREEGRIAEDVARRTEGWSFAFLKELFISYLLRLAHDSSLRKLKLNGKATEAILTSEEVLINQIERLSSQITKLKVADGAENGQTVGNLDGEKPQI